MNKEILNKITYLVGSVDVVEHMDKVSALEPFAERVLSFLNELSVILMKSSSGQRHSDVITFGFWIRRAATQKLKERFEINDGNFHLGRGLAFHIAPSNVPVNFAYSLAAGLLTGNSNIIRVPSKDFPQVTIICRAINEALEQHEEIKPYIALVKYEHNKEVNDALSCIADTRIVWGGDETIAELRKSKLSPRSTEITFADRYSIAVINADVYLALDNKQRIAEDFYNDTYFSDQNACTSPKMVIWLGEQKNEAKELFWRHLHQLVLRKYMFQDIQSVNKLTSSYLIAASQQGVTIERHTDNLLIRATVPEITEELMDFMDHSGFFLEYDCDDILELKPLVCDKRCQTIAYICSRDDMMPLVQSGVKGVDRIVPVGKTMDFDLIWDGYDLMHQLTRIVHIV